MSMVLLNEITSNDIFSIYKIQTNIPIKALKTVNSYIVEDQEKSVLIDVGIGFNLIDLKSGFLKNVDKVIITHFHIDHIGGLSKLLSLFNVDVYMHRQDLNDLFRLREAPEIYLDVIKDLHRENGVPDNLIDKMIEHHPGFWKLIGIREIEDINGLNDGEKISLDSLDLNIIWTPGHTPGHICIYIKNNWYLFTGDHILPDITPNIALIRWDSNPLRDYINSLDKVVKFKVELACPGHRNLISNLNKRILELKDHHEFRLKEILSHLFKYKLNAYQLAGKLTWDVKYDSWNEFPITQKYFAVAETLSHLKYLYEEGFVDRTIQNEVYRYYATKRL